MDSNTIRQKYLKFFADKQHRIISSASLIPENDSSLLFVNAGMSPLIPYLSGEKHPAGKRLVNSQKCFRSEDIDDIGDGRHNTFFEMLGNWSLGDYFKSDQLQWWFEFLIEELELDPQRIYQTVYAGDGDQIKKDEDSIAQLKRIYKKYGLEAQEGPETLGVGNLGPGQELDFYHQRIFAYRDKNWWKRGEAEGELGGPDSETFYDTGRRHRSEFGPYCHPNCDCGRFVEIGNSVFMQYRQKGNSWEELQNKNVDFGGGLERIVMAVNNFDNIFQIDSLKKLIKKTEELSGLKYDQNRKYFEIVADHVKSSVFLLGDDKKLSPSNTDQGYIIRRLIRRALRSGRQLGIKSERWLGELAELVIDFYQDEYGELRRNSDFIRLKLREEELKFSQMIERGEKILNSLAVSKSEISGLVAFNLFQSHGYPLEMTEEIIKEKNIRKSPDFLSEYRAEFVRHQDLSKTASAGKFKGGLADQSEATTKLHTACHLLLAALKKVLGPQIDQRGSNITAERLRFDFSHNEKMSEEQKREVEDLINGAILKKYDVYCREVTLAEARAIGAAGVFADKYGDLVKVYTVGDLSRQPEEIFSREICGGPHVKNIGTLGRFKIQKEESSSAGVRRIKAVLED